MVKRSLTAPLSLGEELTLRRIALGITEFKDLPEQTVARLRAFGCVDDGNRLTQEGRERYELLERPRAEKSTRERKLVSFLAAVQRRARI